MAIEIKIPRLGWSMEEGTFVGWLKKDGESVKVGELLFTLESEKASQDIEAADSGILHIPADAPQPGVVVKVGQVIGLLVERGERTDDEVATQQAAVPSSRIVDSLSRGSPIIAPSEILVKADDNSTRAGISSSPRARRRAGELKVDITQIKGTGRSGRVIEADVLRTASSVISSPTPVLTTMRRAIARRTAESFATVPHFYLHLEIDASALIEFRKQMLPEIESASGVRLTLTDLVLRAQAMALRDCPFANAIWRGNSIVTLTRRDVGLVVGLADGLMIPILRAVDEGSLSSLAKQRAMLVEAAKAGKLSGEALEGGATSLSNLGAARVDEFTAVLPQPHSSILALGRAAPRPLAIDGGVGVRTTLKLSLSVDHRVLDGGPAAEYLGRIAELLEGPQPLGGNE